jgi:hypothetical protein
VEIMLDRVQDVPHRAAPLPAQPRPTAAGDEDRHFADGELVVGFSEQLPDTVLAYHVVGGASDDGRVLLAGHDGERYRGSASELSSYRGLLARMLQAVLAGIPVDRRGWARAALVKRWNAAWGVRATPPEEARDGAREDPCTTCESECRRALER